ncbi:nucleotidyl transferase AbiEii/AbiGii toxin family protein [Halomonas chromatireducens]|uniref:Nucleotidyl transferase AbiEii toxin, Type IV TA system n=1 Tax=Halomonas chromatireducens TaxID=507626 RepID=A0A125R0N4_9GAMM|nr:nucleotidyl transferase AbiEii/AbiGii toxin family protein [Halomonas chromatireducens]AMD02377.1 hypothetical protein LOKO_03333 [Halomonas chromatireducens]
MMYRRAHHRAIGQLLTHFDGDFLSANNILFGGGTRIALELHEFRESVDIDLFCIGRSAYRAARSAITPHSFGPLLLPGHTLALLNDREIRADRDAIRALLEGPGHPIKLEIIHFDNEAIKPDPRSQLFPIPFVGKEGCFATKLTANADRYMNHSKDILDLCMMRREWGEIPEAAWKIACEDYGEGVILRGLRGALSRVVANQHVVLEHATTSLQIEQALAQELISTEAPEWLSKLGLH